MPPQKREKQPPQPKNHLRFDPWNLCSSGHQRPEINTDTPTWRHIRTEKLEAQFGGGTGDGDGWKLVPEGEGRRRAIGCRDIRSYLGVRKRGSEMASSMALSKSGLEGDKENDDGDEVMKAKNPRLHSQLDDHHHHALEETITNTPTSTITTPTPTTTNTTTTTTEKKNQIFAGTTIHINHPSSSSSSISDHTLKHLLITHGAKLSLSLARRSVTHVIVGKPSTPSTGSSSTPASKSAARAGSLSGAGGGLAARKLHSEISRAGRGGVKVVGVEWVTESLKAGKRLSEARFALDLAPAGQRSVLGMFGSS